MVAAKLWPESSEEEGLISTQHAKTGSKVQKKFEQLSITTGESDGTLGLIDSLLSASAKKAMSEDLRVFKPAWAVEVQDKIQCATRLVGIKGGTELLYLMFALAARRLSQSQSWTKRNEVERHKAAVKEDAARAKLREMDPNCLAQTWLKSYEEKRFESSSSTMEFRVSKRMIGECEAVFSAWKSTVSAEERDDRTALVQAESEKFGDAALYADLSADPKAEAIWRHEQGSEILRQWVKLRQAQHDQQRFKIPRYCHPHPFHHPTWSEFGGSSKPKVWYAWNPSSKPLKPEQGGNADGSRRLWMLLPNFQSKEAKAVPLRWQCKRLSKDLGDVNDAVEQAIPRADRMSKAAANLPLLDENGAPIRYRPSHPFSNDAKGWNARVQLDRPALQELEELWDEERGLWRDEGRALRGVRWFVTFAPTLATSEGAGRAIHPKLGWMSFPHAELNKKQKREGHAKLVLSRLPGLRILSVDLGHRYAAACAVWETISAQTIAEACRKHGHDGPSESDLYIHLIRKTDKVRTKGRDKGKKTLVPEKTIYRRVGEDFLRDPKSGELTTTPHPAPWARLDRQFSIKLQGEELPARKASSAEREYVERLEAELERERGKSYPLPWRVDELMAEAVRDVRLALDRHGDVARIAYALQPGSCRLSPGGGDSEHTPETRKAAVLAALTRWHEMAISARWKDDRAIDLWNREVLPLIKKAPFTEPPPLEESDGNDRSKVERREKKIKRWQQIWEDLHAGISRRSEEQEDSTERTERKADSEAIQSLLSPVAELLTTDLQKCMQLAKDWSDRWEDDDKRWPARLKALRRWLLPRGLRVRRGETPAQAKARKGRLHAARHVGGLSLTRIATIRSFWQVQKAYRYKAKPDDLRAGIKLIEEDSAKGYKFGDRSLQAMERMREQRVKQLASRITASALGLGGHWEEVLCRDHQGKLILGKDGKPRMKKVWVEEPTPRHTTCHAIVIENLRNYRPDELQTRRENRSLMSWSAGKVRKYLEEACQLHGLHLREVMPNYTSRQCSRTGMPGLRCDDVPVWDFLTKPWWRKRVKIAKERKTKSTRDKPFDAEHRMLVELDRKWPDPKEMPQDKRKEYVKKVKANKKPLRLIVKGGDLFVAAAPRSCSAQDHSPCPLCDGKRAVQADLGAAANIGLRALLDPDFPGKWWYVPCIEDKTTGAAVPRADKVKGSACFAPDPMKPEKFGSLAAKGASEQNPAGKGRTKRGGADIAEGKETTNYWCDVSCQSLRNAESNGFWLPTPAYWRWVRNRVVAKLRVANGLETSITSDLEPDSLEE